MRAEFRDADFENLAGESARKWRDDEKPLPLRRPQSASNPYPLEALGDVLCPVALKLREVIQAPDALCGQSVLAAACLAAQPHADVEIDGRKSPISENFVTVGESGERKSAVDRIANGAAVVRERELHAQKAVEDIAYQHVKDAYDEKRKRILKNKKLAHSEMQQQLEQLGPPPDPPLDSVLIAEEPTYEGLVKLLVAGQPSVGLFSDEGGRLLGGHGMNQDNQLKTVVGLCELWDGKRMSRVRAGDGSTLLYGRRVSIHIMIQPVVTSRLFQDELMSGQGFLSRSLPAWPASTIGERPYRNVNLAEDPTIQGYQAKLLELFRAPRRLAPDTRNELDPRVLRPNPEAKRFFVAFHDEIESQLKEGRRYAEIKGLGAKIAEHALRLAGCLAILKDFRCQEVQPLEMECGITLARYYLDESLRIKHDSAGSPDILLAEKLLAWLSSRDNPLFYIAEVYQKGPNAIREAAIAKRIVKILENHGYISRQSPQILDGSMRHEVWELRPL